MKNLFYITLLSSLLLVSGCGKNEDKKPVDTPTEKQTTQSASTEETQNQEEEKEEQESKEEESKDEASATGDILGAAEIEKTVAKIKEITGGGKIFQNIIINLDDEGKGSQINLNRQDPKNLGNVDNFTYFMGEWSEPTPVKISGNKEATSDDISKNCWDIDSVNWKAIPDIIKDAKERTKDIEGIKFSQIQIRQNQGKILISMSGTRKDAMYWADLDGKFIELEKK